jgi:hypothetical protein
MPVDYRPGPAPVWNNGHQTREEITFQVKRDEESGILVAWWDDSDGEGGITTQGQDLRDLQQQVTEAGAVHFDDDVAPRRMRVHFVSDRL